MATKPLKTLTFEGLDDIYTVPQIDASLSTTGKAADAKATGDSLAEKASSSGMVDMAKSLVGGKYTSDKQPYHFRKSPSAGAKDEVIVGGSLGWNQLIDNADFKTNTTVTKNGITIEYSPTAHTFTVKAGGTATAATSFFLTNPMNYIPAGHKVLITGLPRDFNSATELFINVYNKSGSNQFYRNMVSPVIVGTGNQSFISIFIRSGFSVASDIVFKPQCIDLTTCFGTTIADYIYSLEQATSGAGVAFVKRCLDLDTYHPYDAGSIQSVEGLQSHNVVGFNQWDEEWEVGGFAWATGQLVGSTDRIRGKNFCRCMPNTEYYNTQPIAMFWYDEDKTFISYSYRNNATRINTSPSNAHYFKVLYENHTTYNHDNCINLSDPSRNGIYEPYDSHSYPLDSSVTLRGVPKLVTDHIEFDGDKYHADGSVERRYGIVDLGTLLWAKNTASNYSYYSCREADIPDRKVGSSLLLCSKYITVSPNRDALASGDKTIASYNSGNSKAIVIRDDSFSDASALKTALSGTYLVYEKATPTTETAQPFQSPMLVGKTEEYVSDSVVPVGHDSRYYEDITGKVNNLPSDFSTLIAPVEKSFTATRNYTVGSYLIVNNQLYKVTSAISTGGTITPNSNVTATTIMAEIMALA